MGKYDHISPGQIRAALVRLARLILRLEEEGALLTSTAELQRRMGDLRRKLFAYEVRSTSHLWVGENEDTAEPAETPDPLLEESMRVVREAMEREEEMLKGWRVPPAPWADEEDDG